MAKIKVKCEVCGKEFERLESQLKKHIFCSKKCSNSQKEEKYIKVVKIIQDTIL